MYKRLLYSNSLVLAYYFVLSFFVLFVVNVAHHTITKRSKHILQTEGQFEDGEINDNNIISPENSKYADENAENTENTAQNQSRTPYKIITVNPGDTISGLLEHSGVTADESHYIVKALSNILNLRKVSSGSEITILYTTNGTKIDFDKIDKIIVSNLK